MGESSGFGAWRRSLGGPAAVLLLTLGCGGKAVVGASPGSGGAGGEAAGGGSGGAGGEPCTPACGEYERCIEGMCQPLSYLSVGVHWSVDHYYVDNMPGQPQPPRFEVVAYASRWVSGSGPDYVEVAADGDCRLLDYRGQDLEFEGIVADAGTISVTSPSLGTVQVPPFNDVGVAAEQLEALAAGEEVAISVAGGADFHAYSATVEAIEPIALLDADPLVRGEPLALSWVPGNAIEQISVSAYPVEDSVDDYGLFIICETSNTGSLTISGTLTALLENQTNDVAGVSVNRRSEQVVEPAALAEVFWARVSGSAIAVVDYVP